METNKSKITIEFEGTAIKFGTENCSYEQEAMACKLLDIRLQQKIMENIVMDAAGRLDVVNDMESLLLGLETLLVSCEHPESFDIESARKVLPIGVRHLVDFYRKKREADEITQKESQTHQEDKEERGETAES